MSDRREIKLVSLLGSLRKASYNAIVARALPELAPPGVQVEPLGSVADFPIYDADIQDQGFPAPVLEMAEAIRRADGVVVVTPEYNYSVPGGLKNALDWLSRLPSPPFAGKPVAIQTASPGMIGGARCQYHLRQSFVFLDAYVLNKPEIMVGQVAGKVDANGRLADPTTRELIGKQLAALAQMIRRNP